MSITEEPILDQGKREFVIKGIASFPFIVHVEAGDAEEAAMFASGMELTDLLLGYDEGEYDSVEVKEVIPFE